MNIQTLLSALNLGEDKDWEYKSAKGGLPSSLWESFCAMANTDGGFIVQGVKELDGSGFEAQGLDDPQKIERDFWNTINNRDKVSANLLTNSNVRVCGWHVFACHRGASCQSAAATGVRQPESAGRDLSLVQRGRLQMQSGGSWPDAGGSV